MVDEFDRRSIQEGDTPEVRVAGFKKKGVESGDGVQRVSEEGKVRKGKEKVGDSVGGPDRWREGGGGEWSSRLSGLGHLFGLGMTKWEGKVERRSRR
jgi:hypothetical protein